MFKVVELLVKSGANLDCVDNSGQNALWYTQRSEDSSASEYLINEGINFGIIDNKDQTILHWVADRGRLEIYQRLLDLDVDSHLRDSRGRTAIDYLLHRYISGCCPKNQLAILQKFFLLFPAGRLLKEREIIRALINA